MWRLFGGGRINDYILLFVGKSGSGKTTVAQACEKRFGMHQVWSYTTRGKRNENEEGHVFIDKDSFGMLKNLVADTFYGGHYYGTTADQIDENEIYVIDPHGVETFFQRYGGKKKIGVVFFNIPDETCFGRMLARGDSYDAARERAALDYAAFHDCVSVWADKECDVLEITDENETIEQTLDRIEEFVVRITRMTKEGNDENTDENPET